jgi:hypothetical protein
MRPVHFESVFLKPHFETIGEAYVSRKIHTPLETPTPRRVRPACLQAGHAAYSN